MSSSQTGSVRRGTSVRLFLEDGTPDGLRTVTKSNWTGLATMCSRTQYLQVRAREDFGRPGVYMLVGDSSEGTAQQRIYIGQADNARERLDSHSKTKDFWTQLVLFTSRDENFNRVHAQYLESKLIQLANAAKRYEMENGNAPRVPALSPADQADAEAFLDDMLVIYPLLGIDAFEVVEPLAIQIAVGTDGKVLTGPGVVGTVSPSETLFLDSSGADAQGQDTPQGFRVFGGSRGRRETVESAPPFVQTIRHKLIDDGVLIERDDALHLTQDYVFSSPSQAATVLVGRSANGRTEWHDASGRTLKTIQLAQLAASVEHDHEIDESIDQTES